MRHILYALMFAMLLFAACNFTTYAQEPTAEPTPAVATDPEPVTDQPSSQNLVNGVTGLIATIAGLISSILINIIKGIPGLNEENKTKLSGATLEVISVIVGVVTGYAVGMVVQGLGLIEDNSLRLMIISIASPIISEIRYRLGQLATKPVLV